MTKISIIEYEKFLCLVEILVKSEKLTFEELLLFVTICKKIKSSDLKPYYKNLLKYLTFLSTNQCYSKIVKKTILISKTSTIYITKYIKCN